MGRYYYKGNDKKILRTAKREAVCSDVVNKFNAWYDDLEPSRQDTVLYLKELFPYYNNKKREVKKVPDFYEQYKTYTSAIQRATYLNYDSILDVEGQDLRSNNLASIYKASLVYDFYRMDLKSILDEVLDDWTLKGEGALFVHWDEEVEQVPTVSYEIEVDEDGIETEPQPIQTLEDVVTGSGIHIKRLDPHNLYYDKSQRHNWQMCGKIYRGFIPIQYILNNTEYKLTNDEKKSLKEMVQGAQDENIDSSEVALMKDKKVIGNTVEVLEYRGDYFMPETYELVRNVEIVVIGRKYLAKMEKSKFPECPIIYNTYMDRPDSKRGQAPLKPAYILSDVENKCMDLTMKAWELSTVPVFLAPKGAFASYTKLEAGKPLEYDPATLGGQIPSKVDFSAGLRGFDFQTFFKTKMEGATGVSQYMQGSTEGSVRTASESSYINQGANMRMGREAYLFSQRLILPLVQLFAKFKKYFDSDDKTIKMNGEGGTPQFVKVDQEVRNGSYTFIIGGAQSQVEREAETRKLFELLGAPAFQSLSQLVDPETATELLKWVLNRNDFRGTDQIFEMIGINKAIESQAKGMGIQPQNQQGFKQDMRSLIQQSIPDMAQALGEQQQQEQLPQ